MHTQTADRSPHVTTNPPLQAIERGGPTQSYAQLLRHMDIEVESAVGKRAGGPGTVSYQLHLVAGSKALEG